MDHTRLGQIHRNGDPADSPRAILVVRRALPHRNWPSARRSGVVCSRGNGTRAISDQPRCALRGASSAGPLPPAAPHVVPSHSPAAGTRGYIGISSSNIGPPLDLRAAVRPRGTGRPARPTGLSRTGDPRAVRRLLGRRAPRGIPDRRHNPSRGGAACRADGSSYRANAASTPPTFPPMIAAWARCRRPTPADRSNRTDTREIDRPRCMLCWWDWFW